MLHSNLVEPKTNNQMIQSDVVPHYLLSLSEPVRKINKSQRQVKFKNNLPVKGVELFFYVLYAKGVSWSGFLIQRTFDPIFAMKYSAKFFKIVSK